MTMADPASPHIQASPSSDSWTTVSHTSTTSALHQAPSSKKNASSTNNNQAATTTPFELMQDEISTKDSSTTSALHQAPSSKKNASSTHNQAAAATTPFELMQDEISTKDSSRNASSTHNNQAATTPFELMQDEIGTKDSSGTLSWAKRFLRKRDSLEYSSDGGQARMAAHSSWWTYEDHEDETGAFHENDWTPHDSSYGAAIPVGGWIPKPIRRLIELLTIGAVITAIVYFIISTSIKISHGEDYYYLSKNQTTNLTTNNDNSGYVNLDDDRYIEYVRSNNDDDTANEVDDDQTRNDGYNNYVNDDDDNDGYTYGGYRKWV